MIKYEIQKIIVNKTTLVFLTFVLIINIVNIFKNYYQDSEKDPVYPVYLEIYQEIQGKNLELCKNIIETELLTVSEKEEKRYLYTTAYEELLQEIEEIQRLDERRNELGKCSAEKAENLKKTSLYLHNLNSKYADIYKNTKIDSYYNINGIEEFINYKFHYILIIVLIISVVSSTFTEEKTKGTYEIIKTTKNGYKKLAFIKVVSVLTFVAILQLLFSICNYICFKICYKFDGIFQPIYMIRNYRELPVDGDIIYFLVKNCILGFLGIAIMALVVVMISLVFNEVKSSVVSSVVFMIFLILLRACYYFGKGKIINLLNPVHCLLGEKVILYFENIKIGNWVIANQYIVVIIAALEIFLILKSIVFIYENNMDIMNFSYKLKKIIDGTGGKDD